jgi:tRNA-specific 2-thiouridylase
MRALCVFSGGLDSMLASQLLRAQGVDVLALFFETPFFSSHKARNSARSLNLPLRVVDITRRHLPVVKNPKHGYGANMNPCIDCHSLMFRIAGEMLDEEGAGFVITGEVLGQRPMSQNKKSLALVGSESGLGGLLLRPLSARHLPPTIPEERGWVKRERLMDFQGRSRKPQMALAKALKIDAYPSPAGGCLLTEEVFSRRLKDLLSFPGASELRDLELLRVGRHFRIDLHTKLVVGRHEKENEILRAMAEDKDLILASGSVPGPTALLSGDLSQASLDLSAAIVAAYSDAKDGEVTDVRMIQGERETQLFATVRDKKGFRRYMI